MASRTHRERKAGGRTPLRRVTQPLRRRRGRAVLFEPDGRPEQVPAAARDIIESGQSQTELQRQKKMFEAVLENLPIAVFIKDAQTLRYVTANRFARKTLGQPVENALGKTVYDLFPKEQADLLDATDRETLATRRMVEIPEQPILGRGGDMRIQHVRKVPVFDERGEPWLVVGIADDITERKRTDAILRETEQRLRLLLESTAEGIYGVDTGGRCTFVNPAALKMLGYRRADALLGEPMHERIHHTRPGGTPYPAADCAIYSAFRSACGAHSVGELFWRADGTGFPVEYWSYPIVQEGAVIGAVVSFLDISERRRAEEELARQRRLLDAIIDNLPLAVFAMDPFTGGHVMRNRIARERFGALPRAGDGAALHEPGARDRADQMPAVHRMAFDARQMVESFEEEAFGPSGRRRIQHVRKVPLFDEHDRPWMLVGIADDITEQRRREEELKRQKKLLDAVIEYLPVGVTVKDARTLRYLLRNRMAEKLTGLTHGATHGKRADDVWPPDLACSINEADSKALAGGTPVSSDFTVLRQLRGRIVRNLKVPVPDDRGQYTHIVSILEDLTDIETAHAALRRSEERLRHLISMSPAAIYSFSLEPPFGTTYVSDNVTAQLGWASAEFTSDPAFRAEHIHPEDRARVRETVQQIVRDEHYACSYRFRHKNGAWRWMHDEARVVRNPDGTPQEGIGIWMDITEQHEATEERVQRTLRQRDALVKEVHHRIKNHLQGIAGLLRQKVPAHPAVAPLLESVVAQMKAVALVYGLQDSADAPVSVQRVVDAICTSLEALLPCRLTRKYDARHAALTLAGSAAVPVAVALNELVHNAIKHGERNAGVASVEIEYAEGGSRAEIRIANSGRLPSGFDYASGAACGTGLDLVKTLLDPEGTTLDIRMRGDEVETALALEPPVVVAPALPTAA